MPSLQSQTKKTAYDAVFLSPLGVLGLQCEGAAITALQFLPEQAPLLLPRSDVACDAVQQLQAWFHDSRCAFSIKLAPAGTDFQRRVWLALCDIPAGETRTYGALAQSLQSSARAIGGACRRNPVPVIVPCHRVVAANGLGGYSGAIEGKLTDIKSWLLKHESEVGWR